MKYSDPEILAWMSKSKGSEVCPFLVCEACGKAIKRSRLDIQKKQHQGFENITCGGTCSQTLMDRSQSVFMRPCASCGKQVRRTLSATKRCKSDRVFCNRSCSTRYNNCHKNHGTRRSKLEAWIESELVKLYPSLEFHFNQKDAINSELDIYVPSLKLAFELNGIYHYEPIHGAEKLATIQNNDSRKLQACVERGISFCTIDTSASKSFKPERDRKYLDIICMVVGAAYPT